MFVVPRALRIAKLNSGILDAFTKEVWELVPVLWRRITNYVLWKAEEKWRAKGWGIILYPLRGMMWADNYWLFSDSRGRLTCMLNDMELSWNHCGGQTRTNTRI